MFRFMFFKIQFLSIFCVFSSFAQTPFLEIPNDLSKKNNSVENAYVVVDNEKKTFSTFMVNEQSINAYLYSQELEPISKFASKGLPEGYNEIIGKTIKNGQVRLYFKEYYNKKFGAVLFDFDRQQSIETEFGFKLQDEIYLQSHSYQDRLYIITVSKKSSILNIYTFQHDGKFEKKSFDFTENVFVNGKNEPTTLYKLLYDSFNGLTSVVKIEESNPNSLQITSNLSKIYDRGDSFILSIDKEGLFTYLLEFKVPDLSVKIASIEKLNGIGDEKFNTTNSYLYKDKIFQIGGNSKIMVLTVKELATKKELKRFVLSKDEDIPFKNSAIIEEYATNQSIKKKELDKTNLLLQIFNGGNSGVAVNPTSTGYQLTLGGNEIIKRGGGGFGGPMVFVGPGNGMMINSTNSGMVVTSGFNPTFYSFGSFPYNEANRTKRIECLFNEDFEHIDGEIPQNVFNRLRNHTSNLPKAKAETVFRMDDYFVYGRYFTIDNVYKFFKFSE
ncbi:MAG: hypothetical protein KDC94_12315 [Aequorivita sp.]|nr:hypothetical protein [Aequorivita sp.]